jgi:hypothetical protein
MSWPSTALSAPARVQVGLAEKARQGSGFAYPDPPRGVRASAAARPLPPISNVRLRALRNASGLRQLLHDQHRRLVGIVIAHGNNRIVLWPNWIVIPGARFGDALLNDDGSGDVPSAASSLNRNPAIRSHPVVGWGPNGTARRAYDKVALRTAEPPAEPPCAPHPADAMIGSVLALGLVRDLGRTRERRTFVY